MKKSIVLTMAGLLLLGCLLPSCESVFQSTQDGQEELTDAPPLGEYPLEDDMIDTDVIPDGDIVISINKRFGATPFEQLAHSNYDEFYSFYDDTNYYYVYYLGCVDHVPLQDNAAIYEYNGNNYTKEFATTVTESSVVAQMVSVVESKSVTKKWNANIKGGYDKKSLGLKVEAGLSRSSANTIMSSSSQSYKRASEYSETHTDRTRFSFVDTSLKGFYRYILFGDVDVFGVLVKEIDSGEYYADIYQVISTQYFSLDYSESAKFNDTNYKTLQFELTQNDLDSLPVPSVYIEDQADPEMPEDKEEINASVYYDSGYNEKIVDASDDLSQIYDLIDMYDLSAYLNSDYVLHFKVEIYMREKYAGYQEIYLCRDDETHVAGVSDHEHGGSGDANKEYMWTTFHWDVAGDKCTPQMLLRYGAHGSYSDDWYRAHVKVSVTVKHN